MEAGQWGPMESTGVAAQPARQCPLYPGGTRGAVLTGPLLLEDIGERRNHKLMVAGWWALRSVGPEGTE